MTSLIDVIFLLLLFFMLSSTFSKFAEVPLPLGAAGTITTGNEAPLFLRILPETITLNGQSIFMADLKNASALQDGVHLLVALAPEVTSQRLTDVLVTLRGLPGLRVNVLVPS